MSRLAMLASGAIIDLDRIVFVGRKDVGVMANHAVLSGAGAIELADADVDSLRDVVWTLEELKKEKARDLKRLEER